MSALTPSELDEFFGLIRHAIRRSPRDENILRLAMLLKKVRTSRVNAVIVEEFIFLTAALATALQEVDSEAGARLLLLLDLFRDENPLFGDEQPLKALDAARAIIERLQEPLAEYESGGYGPYAVRAELDRCIGKTIAKLGFGPTKALEDDPADVDSEWLTLYFADGTALKIEIGLASLGTSFVVGWLEGDSPESPPDPDPS